MGNLADIIDMVKDIKKEIPSDNNFRFKYTRNSISRGSANSIMQFPVLTSNALSMDDLTMVSKALEREYATFVRVMVSMDDVIDLSKGETKLSKIKSMHQNMGVQTSGAIGMKNGSFFAESQDLKYTSLRKSFEDKNIELLACHSEDLNMSILNDMSTANNDNYYHLSEGNGGSKSNYENSNRRKKSNKKDDKDYDYRRASNQIDYNVKRKTAGEKINKARDEAERAANEKETSRLKSQYEADTYDARVSKAKNDAERSAQDLRHSKAKFGMDMARGTTGVVKDVVGIAKSGIDIYNSVERQRWERNDRKMQSTYRGVSRNELSATDVKKANELVPTLLDMSLYYSNGKGPMQETNVVIGVKTVAHLINTDEMVTAIAKAVQEKRNFFRFIQWTTGEISTWKDYILCADRLKDEATSRNSSNWWRRLRNRATADRMNRFSKKDVMPNATIVLTIDEVEYIKNNYNIDLLKNKQAVKALFKTFFLLGFVIVDPMSEMAYFMFDGRDDFEVQSYRALERETNGAGDIKSIISLIDRTR